LRENDIDREKGNTKKYEEKGCGRREMERNWSYTNTVKRKTISQKVLTVKFNGSLNEKGYRKKQGEKKDR